MIHLHVSSSLDDLSHSLVAALRAPSLFTPPATLVVPNRTLRTQLQFRIAEALGVAANLSFQYLRPFLASLVPAPHRLLARDELAALLIIRLQDEALVARPELGPVAAYLRAAGDAADTVDRRRCQLASELARVFDDYALTRPELLDSWRDPARAPSATEQWQRALWLACHAATAKTDARWLDVRALVDAGTALVVPAELHVFGFSTLAPAYQRLLVKLARTSEVHVYTFTPVAELKGPRETPLRAFAKPSLELWREVGVTTTAQFTSSTCSTLLQRLQRDILHGDSFRLGPSPAPLPTSPRSAGGGDERASPGFAGDGTLRVLACPSLAREVEVVAAEIWELVRDADARGEKLRFDEIAVLLAGREQEAYRSQLVSVFSETHEIPVSLSGLAASRESRVLEAVSLLLELPLGGFKRGELLRLLTHPNVLGLVPDAAPDDWVAWCEELTVLGGADRDDLSGTYVVRDLHNWDQGLKRLALGTFLSGARSGDERVARVRGEEYLPLDLAQDEAPSAARLALIVRALVADARSAREARPLSEWARFFQKLVLGYLAPQDDDEGQVLDRCARRLRRLEELDLEKQPVGYRIAFELARGALEESRGGGHELAEGVFVGPLSPSRPIPWKVVFILGLGEGEFPAQARSDLLDLRAGDRRPGEVTATERDRLAFVEVIAAARERVVLSYVARDARTGEPLAPSSVVREVEAAVAPWLDATELAALTVTPPLRRFAASAFGAPLGDAPGRIHLGVSPAPLPASPRSAGGGDERASGSSSASSLSSRWASPEAFREAQVRALRERVPAGTDGLSGLGADVRPVIEGLLGVVPAPMPAAAKSGDVIRVSISALLRFLESPLQAWAEQRLRLRRDAEGGDPLLREDEVFEPTALDETILLREAAFAALRAPGVPKENVGPAYDLLAARAELDGSLPTGVFLEATRASHRRLLDVWLSNLKSALKPEELGALVTHRFGPADERGAADVLHGPLVFELDGPARRVEVHGRTSRVLRDHAGAIVLVIGEEPDEKHALRAFLDHAVLAAAGHATTEPFRALVVPGIYRAAFNYVRRFRPFTSEDARAWLRGVVEDFVSGTHAYLLPIEAALDFLRGKTRYGLASEIRYRRDKPFQRSSDQWAPVERIDGYEPPAGAEGIARRRLGAFVDREIT